MTDKQKFFEWADDELNRMLANATRSMNDEQREKFLAAVARNREIGQIVEGVWKLVEKHVDRSPYQWGWERWRLSCFLCAFGKPVDDPACSHSFWNELWPYLERHGINPVTFRENLRTAATYGGRFDHCTPYMCESFLQRVKEALPR